MRPESPVLLNEANLASLVVIKIKVLMTLFTMVGKQAGRISAGEAEAGHRALPGMESPWALEKATFPLRECGEMDRSLVNNVYAGETEA